jgi:hypothetical protein
MNQLEIGAPVERTLGYLKTLLPSDDGFITARAMYSLDRKDETHLVFETVWNHWEDLRSHQDSFLSEEKVLSEFEPHVELKDLAVHIFEEVL